MFYFLEKIIIQINKKKKNQIQALTYLSKLTKVHSNLSIIKKKTK